MVTICVNFSKIICIPEPAATYQLVILFGCGSLFLCENVVSEFSERHWQNRTSASRRGAQAGNTRYRRASYGFALPGRICK